MVIVEFSITIDLDAATADSGVPHEYIEAMVKEAKRCGDKIIQASYRLQGAYPDRYPTAWVTVESDQEE